VSLSLRSRSRMKQVLVSSPLSRHIETTLRKRLWKVPEIKPTGCQAGNMILSEGKPNRVSKNLKSRILSSNVQFRTFWQNLRLCVPISSPYEKVGGHVPRAPHLIAPMAEAEQKCLGCETFLPDFSYFYPKRREVLNICQLAKNNKSWH